MEMAEGESQSLHGYPEVLDTAGTAQTQEQAIEELHDVGHDTANDFVHKMGALKDQRTIHRPRAPRETGFGDFCFEIGEQTESSDHVTLDRNTPPIELDGFQRSGTFAFFKLPLEIRRHIYQLIFFPLLTAHGYGTRKPSQGLVFINLRRAIDTPGAVVSPWYQQNLESFRERQGPVYKELGFTPQQIEESESQFLRRREGLRKMLQRSLDRASAYKMYVDAPSAELTALVVELIRNVTNTCTQMRQEFGSTFWERVILNIDRFNQYTATTLLDFLRDRPSIHRGIKTLDLHIDECMWNDDKRTQNSSVEVFRQLNEYINVSLEVEMLMVMAFIQVESIERVTADLQDLPITKFISNMRIKDGFMCSLRVLSEEEEFDTEEEMSAYNQLFVDQYESRISDCWFPNSLAYSKPEPRTESEIYLAARNASFPEASSVTSDSESDSIVDEAESTDEEVSTDEDASTDEEASTSELEEPIAQL